MCVFVPLLGDDGGGLTNDADIEFDITTDRDELVALNLELHGGALGDTFSGSAGAAAEGGAEGVGANHLYVFDACCCYARVSQGVRAIPDDETLGC